MNEYLPERPRQSSRGDDELDGEVDLIMAGRDVEIILPTLHAGQKRIWQNRARFNVVRCGRRFGKTKMITTLAASSVVHGNQAGTFAPEYRQLAEPYSELASILDPIRKSSSKTDGTFIGVTGGKADFWTLNDNPLAGRGRTYHRILIDEAAFTKSPQMLEEIWQKAIKPTLWTTQGDVWVFSTPMGIDPLNFFYACCRDEGMGFKEHYAPTSENPLIPMAELELEKAKTDPRVWAQEFLAEFVDWSGDAFFDKSKCLGLDGLGVPYPIHCDTVFAVLDTAIKTGRQHDGTAVGFFAVNTLGTQQLTLLDWDIVQVEGALLETWLPTIFQRLEELARQTGARGGSAGAWIEDKASGTILLQQAIRRNWMARSIDSKLTSLGKDERAISVSGYVHQGLFKLSQYAFDKTVIYKGRSENYFMTQFFGYRIGIKDQADDLLDVGCYGLALSFGNNEGY